MESVDDILRRVSLAIIAARESNEISQADMAKLLKISQSSLSRIEAGKTVPELTTWMLFCEHFGIDFNTSFDITPKPGLLRKRS